MNNSRTVYGKYGANTFSCPWCGRERHVDVRSSRTECTCMLCGGKYHITICDSNTDKLFMELIGAETTQQQSKDMLNE